MWFRWVNYDDLNFLGIISELMGDDYQIKYLMLWNAE